MDAAAIIPGAYDYAYVEYPKRYAHLTAQPNPMRVRVVKVDGDQVTMRRQNGRSFLVGAKITETHTVPSRKIICTWDALEEARQRRDRELDERAALAREVEEVLPYFEGINDPQANMALADRLSGAFVKENYASVALTRGEALAIGRRIQELQNLAAQNALVADDEGSQSA